LFFYFTQILPFYCFKYKIDVLHSLGYSSPLITSCKKIVTIHDLNWYFYPEDFSFLEKLAWKISTTISAKFSDHIITDSISSKNDLEKYFSVSNKITAILCGSPKKVLPINISKILKKYKIKKKYLFTVLGPYPHKNLNTAIVAWKNFSSSRKDKNLIQFVVCGTKSNFIDEKNNIVYLPHLSKEELATLYRGAHVFIFPSLYEGFGFPPIEAMSYGIPVISSDSASLAEVVGRGGILIKTNDANLYSKELKKIWDNEEKVFDLSKKGLSWVKKFTWEDAAKFTMDIYKNIL